ncbi:phosphatase PAP2 family protein [Candidatus Nanosalina sp. VS9-1]|uniref:phosphatase PAP2 family protein n=1 Tax=Candidatus Nanosalina sp. VS9-1 TaxID=3388566 RepID=UPI0039E1228A
MKLEEAVSDVFNPLLVVPSAALIFLNSQLGLFEAFYWTSLGVMTSLTPTLIAVYFTENRGLRIDSRDKRPKAYMVGLVSMAGTLAIFQLISAPSVIVSAGIGGILSIVAFAAANYFSKVSIHTGAMTLSAAVLYQVTPLISFTGFVLAVLTGWSRVKLERHTLMQVIYGAVLGLTCGLLLVL